VEETGKYEEREWKNNMAQMKKKKKKKRCNNERK
jgi:hypothetical protein